MPAPSITMCAIVGCGSAKQARCVPARELYTGSLFRAARDHVEARRLPWRIFSGLHGLVTPDRVLTPYEQPIPRSQPPEWWERLRADLQAWRSELPERVEIELHMGRRYADAIAQELAVAGFGLPHRPVAGLAVGHRLHWYADRRAA